MVFGLLPYSFCEYVSQELAAKGADVPIGDQSLIGLTQECAAALGVEEHALGVAYGRHFVKEGAAELLYNQNPVLSCSGQSLPEWVEKLNDLHHYFSCGAVSATDVWVDKVTPDSFRLYCRSDSPIYTHWLEGLIDEAARCYFGWQGIAVKQLSNWDDEECEIWVLEVSPLPGGLGLDEHCDKVEVLGAEAKASLYGMEAYDFYRLFPFHLILDKACKIVQAGSMMRRMFPDLNSPVSYYAADFFDLCHPLCGWSFDLLVQHHSPTSIVMVSCQGLELKGSFSRIPLRVSKRGGCEVVDAALFMGSPYFESLSDMMRHGVCLSDLPCHDMSVDLLFAREMNQSNILEMEEEIRCLKEERDKAEVTSHGPEMSLLTGFGTPADVAIRLIDKLLSGDPGILGAVTVSELVQVREGLAKAGSELRQPFNVSSRVFDEFTGGDEEVNQGLMDLLVSRGLQANSLDDALHLYEAGYWNPLGSIEERPGQEGSDGELMHDPLLPLRSIELNRTSDINKSSCVELGMNTDRGGEVAKSDLSMPRCSLPLTTSGEPAGQCRRYPRLSGGLRRSSADGRDFTSTCGHVVHMGSGYPGTPALNPNYGSMHTTPFASMHTQPASNLGVLLPGSGGGACVGVEAPREQVSHSVSTFPVFTTTRGLNATARDAAHRRCTSIPGIEVPERASCPENRRSTFPCNSMSPRKKKKKEKKGAALVSKVKMVLKGLFGTNKDEGITFQLMDETQPDSPLSFSPYNPIPSLSSNLPHGIDTVPAKSLPLNVALHKLHATPLDTRPSRHSNTSSRHSRSSAHSSGHSRPSGFDRGSSAASTTDAGFNATFLAASHPHAFPACSTPTRHRSPSPGSLAMTTAASTGDTHSHVLPSRSSHLKSPGGVGASRTSVDGSLAGPSLSSRGRSISGTQIRAHLDGLQSPMYPGPPASPSHLDLPRRGVVVFQGNRRPLAVACDHASDMAPTPASMASGASSISRAVHSSPGKSKSSSQRGLAKGGSNSFNASLTVVVMQMVKEPSDELSQILGHVDEWQFDIFELQRVTNGRTLSVLAFALFKKAEIVSRFGFDEQKLVRFLVKVEDGYPPNPYHCREHAADVLRMLHVIATRGGLVRQAAPVQLEPGEIMDTINPNKGRQLHQQPQQQQPPMKAHEDARLAPTRDAISLLIVYLAAIIHDYDHRGVNNQYLVQTVDPLAILYNDMSPMENHHTAAAFSLLKEEKHNFLDKMPTKVWCVLRTQLIDMVLATDMKQHFGLVSLFQDKSAIAIPTPTAPLASASTSAVSHPLVSVFGFSPTASSSTILRTSTNCSLTSEDPGSSLSPIMSQRSFPITRISSLPASSPLTSSPLANFVGSGSNSMASSSSRVFKSSMLRKMSRMPHWTLSHHLPELRASSFNSIGEDPLGQDQLHFRQSAPHIDTNAQRHSEALEASITSASSAQARIIVAIASSMNSNTTSAQSSCSPLSQAHGVTPARMIKPQGPNGLHPCRYSTQLLTPTHNGERPASSASYRFGSEAGAVDLRKSFSIRPVALDVSERPLAGSPSKAIAAGEGGGPPSTPPLDAEFMVLVWKIALKCADLSNLANARPVAKKWVLLLEEEMFRQGDKEQLAGLPISALMDRSKAGVTKSQPGFFNVVALPLFSSFVKSFPASAPMLEGAKDNLAMWLESEQKQVEGSSAALTGGGEGKA